MVDKLLPNLTVFYFIKYLSLSFSFSPGILDQGQGVLIVFEDSTVDQTYTTTLDTISSMGKVVDSLYNRAKHLQ